MGLMNVDVTRAAGTAGSRLDDGLARGMELVLTPTLLALIGFLADRSFGLLPVLTIAFALIGVVGMGLRSYYRYETQMKAIEAAGPWATAAVVAPPVRSEPLLRDQPAGLPTGVRL